MPTQLQTHPISMLHQTIYIYIYTTHTSPLSSSYRRIMVSVPSTSSFLRPSHHSRISVTRSTPSPSCVRFRPPCVTAAAAVTSLCSPKLTTSYYKILGIPKGATSQEIKAAYRRLARVCHPDAVEEDRKESSADEFIKIHAAYSTLLDPERRAVYDRNLSYRPFVTSRAGFSSYTRRNWETDQCW
ncbi:chaperone protein dnaJ 11, chloroplastic-like [Cornus florida]|uniref:chaperone protein dnaJ 11, chloroplastic-like n=1 Tax=Cornus florida TaxID=4283 RepID=UPI00289C836B|nr:chaperone protein dnaJ 11, chloroplastic-like [Cornus florida]